MMLVELLQIITEAMAKGVYFVGGFLTLWISGFESKEFTETLRIKVLNLWG